MTAKKAAPRLPPGLTIEGLASEVLAYVEETGDREFYKRASVTFSEWADEADELVDELHQASEKLGDFVILALDHTEGMEEAAKGLAKLSSALRRAYIERDEIDAACNRLHGMRVSYSKLHQDAYSAKQVKPAA